ncbi:uncharacterized protein [Dermacentor andersoni]|uniref:uncharacterized protein isoform X1 n=1 Tax=Dermacentor andersoni TaxID=34620 RepID=UPI002155711E|nr:uncharacterized protein LOC126543804 isoform X1 [Dermacentor andersoni]XP_054934310.1 uncharacterized protein LOC126543804 isoform X1 [Dermacentor andersoni]XP_054934311.1 uncharacterized protein LOC126543804 isoform X1 [Dermacentor andersoni]
MVKANRQQASAHVELEDRFSTSHLELRHDGGTVRLSYLNVLMTFMLFLTVFMMASGVAVSAATSWLVGSVLILPAVLLLCATALVATWVMGRHSVHERSSSDPFPSVVYSPLAQHDTDVRHGFAARAESGILPQRDPEKPRQQSRRGYTNVVSFME